MAERRKLSNIECERLIAEVQSRPCLWNDRHSDFKNTAVTKVLWEEVGRAVKLSGDECKKKWKNLKDTFRKKVQTSMSKPAGSPPHKKWKFTTSMEFTRDLLSSSMVGSLQPPSTSDEDSNRNDEAEDCPSPQQDTTSSYLDAEEKASLPHHPPRGSRTKDANSRMLERRVNAISNTGKEDDEKDDYYFFMSLLPYVKRLSDLEKLQLRSKIQNSVLEALRDHERFPPQPYSPHSAYSSNASSSLERTENVGDHPPPPPEITFLLPDSPY